MMPIESKPNTETAETVPIESGSDSSESDQNNNDDNEGEGKDNTHDTNKETDVCPICFEGFEIVDIALFHHIKGKKKRDNKNIKEDWKSVDTVVKVRGRVKDHHSYLRLVVMDMPFTRHVLCNQSLADRCKNDYSSCRSVFMEDDDDDADNPNDTNNNNDAADDDDDDVANTSDCGNNNLDNDLILIRTLLLIRIRELSKWR
mmetsp:Transcript_53765/g.60856  ORF Transcript_53765/g.60856 Transcript_53765/m.60856 type:complete len:202 (-) Transcript_53765:241-846(-)